MTWAYPPTCAALWVIIVIGFVGLIIFVVGLWMIEGR